MTRCPRCRSARIDLEAEGDGYAYVCKCGYAWKHDAPKVHRLLNGNAPKPKPARTCHSCDAKVLDATLCSTCLRDVARWLRQIPALADELDTTIAKQTRFAEDTQHVTGTATQPLPLQPEASDVRDHLRAVLVSWVKFHHEETA
jgi:DNA-directed RNA polymerase subunit M/transcription elongation factor TFIIS